LPLRGNWQGTTNNTKATGRRLDVVLFESRGMGGIGIRGWKIGEKECVTENDGTFCWKIKCMKEPIKGVTENL